MAADEQPEGLSALVMTLAKITIDGGKRTAYADRYIPTVVFIASVYWTGRDWSNGFWGRQSAILLYSEYMANQCGVHCATQGCLSMEYGITQPRIEDLTTGQMLMLLEKDAFSFPRVSKELWSVHNADISSEWIQVGAIRFLRSATQAGNKQ